MGFEFVCESCGKHLTIPPNLYEKRVKGRVVNVGCKGCGAPVRIDGTVPPPPVAEIGSDAATSSSPAEAAPLPIPIPKAPRLPASDVTPLSVTALPPVRSAAPPPPDEVDEAWDAPEPPAPTQSALPTAIPGPDPISTPPPGPSSEPSPTSTPIPSSRPSSQPPPLLSPTPPAPSSAPIPPFAFLPSPVPSSEPTEADRARPQREATPPSSPEASASPPSQLSESIPPISASEPDDAFIASTGPTGEPDEPPPISHVTGPIYVRSPIAKIGRYALFDKFASGGMATVHMGRLDGAGGFSRVVAIKRLLPHLVQSSEFSEMLLNEARLAARVRHPNVVPTLDVVASKGEVLLVLEYVHGEALSALCRSLAKKRGVVPVGVAVSVMQGVLQGLHAVHEATDERGRSLGLVHRDVSPQNVMVGTDGMARVLDFGIVKALQQIEETIPTRLKGKTGYMSPEQIRGERLTRASDIFAAAIVLWEMLTLRRFCPGKTDKERIDKILSGDYARPGSHRLDLAKTLDDVLMKALSFDAGERYRTAREFADALGACSEPASATTVTAWVEGLAERTLLERARLLAQVENWDDGAPEIELSSTPFAVERAILDLDDDGTGGSRASAQARAAARTPMPAVPIEVPAVPPVAAADATLRTKRVVAAVQPAARAAQALARRFSPDAWLNSTSRTMRRENLALVAIGLVALLVLVIYVVFR